MLLMQRRFLNSVEQIRWSFCKTSERVSDVNYFHKNLHVRCLTEFWICHCDDHIDIITVYRKKGSIIDFFYRLRTTCCCFKCRILNKRNSEAKSKYCANFFRNHFLRWKSWVYWCYRNAFLIKHYCDFG